MKLTIGFSPCPNDTFIFDALVNGKIDTDDLEFEPVLEDVETLNRWAIEGKLDITKLSFPAYFQTQDTYELLNAGSALGKGVGPLLVCQKNKSYTDSTVNQATVLLPGQHTTAHLLFGFAYPKATKKAFTLFHEIETALLEKKADLGVIIHENRFTYQERGLAKVKDLGKFWEDTMRVPIPLGGIVIKKSLGKGLYNEIDRLIQTSLDLAFQVYPQISNYVKDHAQAMNEEVMRQHIELYVNDFTRNLGVDGKLAIDALEAVYDRMNRDN